MLKSRISDDFFHDLLDPIIKKDSVLVCKWLNKAFLYFLCQILCLFLVISQFYSLVQLACFKPISLWNTSKAQKPRYFGNYTPKDPSLNSLFFIYFQEETKNSAALGSALRARYVFQGGEKVLSFSHSIGQQERSNERCILPHKDAKSVSKDFHFSLWVYKIWIFK